MQISKEQLTKLAAAYELLTIIGDHKWEEHGDMDEHDLACNAQLLMKRVFMDMGVTDQYGNMIEPYNQTYELIRDVYSSGYRRLGK
ncbi:MAG: hypothetical protein EKK48_28455 [Candidatus Melainabacteria bacterium]|nr:MAG: hypothetical protein EKK48_28455 [Candidatus Melainabacteria bacterium]